MYDELSARLARAEAIGERNARILHGNPENPEAAPGLIAEHRELAFNQQRTNEILEDVRGDIKDVRGDLKKIGFMVIALFVAGIGNMIIKK